LKFSDLDLHPDLLDGLDALRYESPTPIQAQAIPVILSGRDLIGVAQTGTGKTAAFVLPIIDLILSSGTSGVIQALIIVPTRELAVQIDQVIEAYSYFTGVGSMAIYGGGDGKTFGQEKTAITTGVDIIVATPGRLLAHINLGYVDFSKLEYLVLDEADRMLDMGFMPDLTKIIEKTNPERQTLLFSATMPDGVAKLARTLLRNPERITIALSKPAENVQQGVYMVADGHKMSLIIEILKGREGQRIVVFGSSKKSVSTLFRRLQSYRLPVGQISSDLEQEEREKVMLDFRNRAVDILVATDVVSRGIDVEGIDLVINFDVPHDAEDYVHRVGRTARAAKKGEAITLVSGAEQRKFKSIEKLIGSMVPRLPLPAHLSGEPEGQPPMRQGGRQSGSNRPHSGHRPAHPSSGQGQRPQQPQQQRPPQQHDPQTGAPNPDNTGDNRPPTHKKKYHHRPKNNNSQPRKPLG
jgi:ATP-dependent RNA helicase RhlE